MSRKKKINLKVKRMYFVLIILLCILASLMSILLTKKLISNSKTFYEVESRIAKLSNSKDSDTPDYDTVGWLKIQGTNIDYPIIHSKKESFSYPMTLESYGWVTSSDGKYHNVINIDGHNLFNLGSNIQTSSENFKRFEELMNFTDYDFAKNNQYFQFTIDGKDYLYKIFSAAFMYSSDSNMFIDNGYDDKNLLDEHIKFLKDYSLYDYGVDVNSDDDIISIRTCSRFFGLTDSYDFVVSGRLIRKGESIVKDSVRRTKNYEKVEEVKKGDDLDES